MELGKTGLQPLAEWSVGSADGDVVLRINNAKRGAGSGCDQHDKRSLALLSGIAREVQVVM